jgi:hypothetical protein
LTPTRQNVPKQVGTLQEYLELWLGNGLMQNVRQGRPTQHLLGDTEHRGRSESREPCLYMCKTTKENIFHNVSWHSFFLIFNAYNNNHVPQPQGSFGMMIRYIGNCLGPNCTLRTNKEKGSAGINRGTPVVRSTKRNCDGCKR